MMKQIVMLAVLLMTFWVNPAFAESGNELLNNCNNYSVAKGTFEQGFCLGMIMGVEGVSNKICRPKGVTNKQLVLVVEKFLKNNPQELHYSAISLAEYALSEAWPCHK